MTKQIKRVIADGKPLAVIKRLIETELLKQDKASWNSDMIAEYDLLFPEYSEIVAIVTEDKHEHEALKKSDANVVITMVTDLGYSYKRLIDYSEDESYKIYADWIAETRVVTEATEAIYDEDGMIVEEAIAEVTELVRPYTPIEVTDEMIQVELDKLGYVAKEKIEAQKYLNDTDWYVTRLTETGVEIPQEVLVKRAECRELL